jgi:subfamily B ATP-binding cassette protein MsbA
VQEALEKIMHNRTTIIIAHRLSTIKSADEIICMRRGEIVEKGSHTELMNKKQIYFRLVSQQVLK